MTGNANTGPNANAKGINGQPVKRSALARTKYSLSNDEINNDLAKIKSMISSGSVASQRGSRIAASSASSTVGGGNGGSGSR